MICKGLKKTLCFSEPDIHYVSLISSGDPRNWDLLKQKPVFEIMLKCIDVGNEITPSVFRLTCQIFIAKVTFDIQIATNSTFGRAVRCSDGFFASHSGGRLTIRRQSL